MKLIFQIILILSIIYVQAQPVQNNIQENDVLWEAETDYVITFGSPIGNAVKPFQFNLEKNTLIDSKSDYSNLVSHLLKLLKEGKAEVYTARQTNHLDWDRQIWESTINYPISQKKIDWLLGIDGQLVEAEHPIKYPHPQWVNNPGNCPLIYDVKPASFEHKLSISQDWYYDHVNNNLTVNTKELGMNIVLRNDRDSDIMHYYNAFNWQYNPHTSAYDPHAKGPLYLGEIVWAKEVNLAFRKEGDAVYITPDQDWQEGKGQCRPLKSMYQAELPWILFQGVLKGKIRAYPARSDGSPDFSKSLSIEELKENGIGDTTFIEDFLTGELLESITPYNANTKFQNTLRVKQHWEYNNKTNELTSTIHAVGLILDDVNGTNEKANRKTLFWIKFD